MLLGLRTAIYPAKDLAAAKQWYARILACTPHVDEAFYVGFHVGGFELGLIPDGTPGVDGPQPLWGVGDIAAAFAQLMDMGATSLEAITDVGGGIKVAAVCDPFGNRLGLIENLQFNPADVR